ncbi:MAG: hypothetical protein E7672_04550 [Ruminococcaceae bacterium]|nr:hypothetical protein [Oscillospiraceae bacterium]
MKITTLTLSPAVDIEYHTSNINTAGLNRASSHTLTAGGKGINVSRALLGCAREDGVDLSRVLRTVAPTGGATGEMMRKILSDEKIPVTAVQIDGNTRVNISLISDLPGQDSIEINAPGTPLGERIEAIENLILGSLEKGDVVAICGSCPADVNKKYPSELARRIKRLGGYVILDCDGAALYHSLTPETEEEKKLCPDLVKPNAKELSDFVGRELSTPEDAAEAAEAVCANTGGITTIITTLSCDGAVLTKKDSDGIIRSRFFPTEKKQVIRLKGAGDTFLGSYIYSRFVKNSSEEDAIASAVRCAGCYVEGK